MINAVIKQHANNKNQYSVKAVLDAALSLSLALIIIANIALNNK